MPTTVRSIAPRALSRKPGPLLLVLALLLGACTAALAARTFPENSRQVRITQVADDAIEADGRSFHLAPGVLIYSTTNSTLVRGALPVGLIARIQTDLNGDVRRIWLLTDDEILVRPWWQFWKRDQPQTGQ